MFAALGYLCALSMGGCAGRATPKTVDPGVAAAAVERTAPDRPLRVIFAWRAQDREARFDGRGAARVAPPYRARLDLFGPRGDGYLTAVLSGSEIRLPPGTSAAVQLPAPALMWAVLGTVRPPEDAVLAGTRVEGDVTELHYAVARDRLVYVLRSGRLRSAEWEGPGRRMTVQLEGAMGGLPGTAVYREWSGYTELVMNLESVDEVEPFPPEIWTPGR